jgi:hypothetical protein
MIDILGQAGQSEHWAYLWLWFFLEILPIDSIQVMRTLISDYFNGLETFVDVCFLFVEIVGVGGIGIKFIPLWIVNHAWL